MGKFCPRTRKEMSYTFCRECDEKVCEYASYIEKPERKIFSLDKEKNGEKDTFGKEKHRF